MKDIKLLQVELKVYILVEEDNIPSKIVSTTPITIMAKNWDTFKLPIDEIMKELESKC